MEKWFKTLTTQELKTWLKNFDQGGILADFFTSDFDKEHIKMARAELNSREVEMK